VCNLLVVLAIAAAPSLPSDASNTTIALSSLRARVVNPDDWRLYIDTSDNDVHPFSRLEWQDHVTTTSFV
jgi:hypothetical protein